MRPAVEFASFALDRFPAARIICFEPLPGPREKLALLPRARVEVHGVAIGAESGVADLTVSKSDDSSSLLPIGPRQLDEFPGTERERSIQVPVATLADYLNDRLPAPRLLKIDVQGFELEVLRGAGDRLALIDELFVECSFVELYQGQALADEIVCFLRSAGFRLVGVHGLASSADGSSLQADFLFRRI